MRIVYNLEKVLATPPLNGLILPGITRQSVLDLAKEWDELRVEERDFTMDELIDLNDNNRVSFKKRTVYNYSHIILLFVVQSKIYIKI